MPSAASASHATIQDARPRHKPRPNLLVLFFFSPCSCCYLSASLVSSLIAVLIITLLLIGHPAASLIVFGSTLLAVVEIL